MASGNGRARSAASTRQFVSAGGPGKRRSLARVSASSWPVCAKPSRSWKARIVARVCEPVVVPLVTDERAEHRLELEQLIPIAFGERLGLLSVGVEVDHQDSSRLRVGRCVLQEAQGTGAVDLQRGSADEPGGV